MPIRTLHGTEAFDAKLRELAAKIDRPGSVNIGFLGNAGSTYPDGTPIALVAAIQEFGAPARGIPPRPYFRSMIAKESPRWAAALAAYLKASGMDVGRALGMAGELISGQLRQSIIALTSPPLSPKTVARKGSDKPLVDTGLMLRSVTYEVKEGAPK